MEDDGPRKIPNKCPLSQKPFEMPVAIVDHTHTCVFEKAMIISYISAALSRNQIEVKCPNPGCNKKMTAKTLEDIEVPDMAKLSIELKKYLQ